MSMNPINFFLIGLAAACGAWVRLFTGLFMSSLFPGLPLGTLVVNLVGGLLMGISLATFHQMTSLSEELKLILNVGFLGGLTTYSAYTADIFNLIQRGEIGFAIAFILAHIIGALGLCFIGYQIINLLCRSF